MPFRSVALLTLGAVVCHCVKVNTLKSIEDTYETIDTHNPTVIAFFASLDDKLILEEAVDKFENSPTRQEFWVTSSPQVHNCKHWLSSTILEKLAFIEFHRQK
jgi:hypothetical protein